jgi:hypothetical protein
MVKHAQALMDVTKIAIGNLNFLISGLDTLQGVLYWVGRGNLREYYNYGKMPKNPHYRSPPPTTEVLREKNLIFSPNVKLALYT